MSVANVPTIGASLKLMVLEEAIRRLINGSKGNGLAVGATGVSAVSMVSESQSAPPSAGPVAGNQAGGARLDTVA